MLIYFGTFNFSLTQFLQMKEKVIIIVLTMLDNITDA
jgi:hypothetical protein